MVQGHRLALGSKTTYDSRECFFTRSRRNAFLAMEGELGGVRDRGGFCGLFLRCASGLQYGLPGMKRLKERQELACIDNAVKTSCE